MVARIDATTNPEQLDELLDPLSALQLLHIALASPNAYKKVADNVGKLWYSPEQKGLVQYYAALQLLRELSLAERLEVGNQSPAHASLVADSLQCAATRMLRRFGLRFAEVTHSGPGFSPNNLDFFTPRGKGNQVIKFLDLAGNPANRSGIFVLDCLPHHLVIPWLQTDDSRMKINVIESLTESLYWTGHQIWIAYPDLTLHRSSITTPHLMPLPEDDLFPHISGTPEPPVTRWTIHGSGCITTANGAESVRELNNSRVSGNGLFRFPFQIAQNDGSNIEDKEPPKNSLVVAHVTLCAAIYNHQIKGRIMESDPVGWRGQTSDPGRRVDGASSPPSGTLSNSTRGRGIRGIAGSVRPVFDNSSKNHDGLRGQEQWAWPFDDKMEWNDGSIRTADRSEQARAAPAQRAGPSLKRLASNCAKQRARESHSSAFIFASNP
ncbi:hypothetical protein B0H11DRAFT_1905925 [Mycena galericulata]|nr:hypothetical protein B0H11DRAFT_1905925 [Mycena galericulata]